LSSTGQLGYAKIALAHKFSFRDRRETPVHGVFPARSKLNRAQTGARLRVAPGTCVPVVAIRATEIPPSQPLYRGFPEVSFIFSKMNEAGLILCIRTSAHVPQIGWFIWNSLRRNIADCRVRFCFSENVLDVSCSELRAIFINWC
jgi:hypothetical protein